MRGIPERGEQQGGVFLGQERAHAVARIADRKVPGAAIDPRRAHASVLRIDHARGDAGRKGRPSAGEVRSRNLSSFGCIRHTGRAGRNRAGAGTTVDGRSGTGFPCKGRAGQQGEWAETWRLAGALCAAAPAAPGGDPTGCSLWEGEAGIQATFPRAWPREAGVVHPGPFGHPAGANQHRRIDMDVPNSKEAVALTLWRVLREEYFKGRRKIGPGRTGFVPSMP
jgi:hypothetical protein